MDGEFPDGHETGRTVAENESGRLLETVSWNRICVSPDTKQHRQRARYAACGPDGCYSEGSRHLLNVFVCYRISGGVTGRNGRIPWIGSALKDSRCRNCPISPPAVVAAGPTHRD